MNKKRCATVILMLAAVMLMLAPMAFAQCGSGNRVDFGNADLGRQLSSSSVQNTDIQLASLVSQMQHLMTAQAPRQAAAASSASTLNQPGYLTFQENVVARQVMPVPEVSSQSEVAALRAEIASLMAEVHSLQSARSSTPVFQTAAFQSGGAAASSSASTAAPSVAQLALTAPAPVAARSSPSACSSGGCGGRRALFSGRRNVSVSRSFSRSSSR